MTVKYDFQHKSTLMQDELQALTAHLLPIYICNDEIEVLVDDKAEAEAKESGDPSLLNIYDEHS
ncbi:7646_t:CDS:2, partial [Scutellospora calospora]